MIIKIYAIRDAKAEAFLQPMYGVTDGQTLRVFEDAVNNPDAPYGKHPEDYSIWSIGAYDDAKGQLLPLDAPTCIGQAVEYKKAA